MVQLVSLIAVLATAVSAVSAACTCVPGQNYCGFELIDIHGCTSADLGSPGGDIFDQLYKCNANGRNATQIQICTRCQPPNHVGGACNGINSCCDP